MYKFVALLFTLLLLTTGCQSYNMNSKIHSEIASNEILDNIDELANSYNNFFATQIIDDYTTIYKYGTIINGEKRIIEKIHSTILPEVTGYRLYTKDALYLLNFQSENLLNELYINNKKNYKKSYPFQVSFIEQLRDFLAKNDYNLELLKPKKSDKFYWIIRMTPSENLIQDTSNINDLRFFIYKVDKKTGLLISKTSFYMDNKVEYNNQFIELIELNSMNSLDIFNVEIFSDIKTKSHLESYLEQ